MVAESQCCQILLVDPDQSGVEVIHSVLSETGAFVHAACSVEQALDVFASHSIDIVIGEVHLSEGNALDGLELMSRLALVDHSMQIIFLTRNHDLDTELKAIGNGAFAYLRKPIAHSTVLQHVAKRAYDYSKLRRQNQNLQLQLDESREQLVAAESALQEVKKKFRRLAVTDSLTHLYNRRFVEQMLKQEVDRRNRYKIALSMVFIDVDGFTQLCQEYGHEVANFVLKDIAGLLLQCSRTSDIVGRFAPDVFVVLLPETTPQNALIFAERAAALIAETTFGAGAQQPTRVTACLGVSGVEVTSRSITDKQLTVAASKALHVAKTIGPGGVSVYPKLNHPGGALKSQTQGDNDKAA